jgi:hypothetical protein
MTTPMTTTPHLKRPAYHVWLAPEGIDPDTAADDELAHHHVVVHHADQLRAELEAAKLKLDARKHPMHVSSLWLWAALVRTGRYDRPYAEFKRDLVAYDPDKEREAPHTDPDTADTADELDARPTAASTS